MILEQGEDLQALENLRNTLTDPKKNRCNLVFANSSGGNQM